MCLPNSLVSQQKIESNSTSTCEPTIVDKHICIDIVAFLMYTEMFNFRSQS